MTARTPALRHAFVLARHALTLLIHTLMALLIVALLGVLLPLLVLLVRLMLAHEVLLQEVSCCCASPISTQGACRNGSPFPLLKDAPSRVFGRPRRQGNFYRASSWKLLPGRIARRGRGRLLGYDLARRADARSGSVARSCIVLASAASMISLQALSD